jgi:hypothetical protein
MQSDNIGGDAPKEIVDGILRRGGELISRRAAKLSKSDVGSPLGGFAGWLGTTGDVGYGNNLATITNETLVTSSLMLGSKSGGIGTWTRLGFGIIGGSGTIVGGNSLSSGGYGFPVGTSNGDSIFPCQCHDEMINVSNYGASTKWAGNIKDTGNVNNFYNTGTITVTNGSPDIVGLGTSWASNTEAGMYIYIDNATDPIPLNSRTYKILEVVDNTNITLDSNITISVASRATLSYAIQNVGMLAAPTGIFKGVGGVEKMVQAEVCSSHQDRLFVAHTYEPGDPGVSGTWSDLAPVTWNSLSGFTWDNVFPGSEGHPHRIRWSAESGESSAPFIGRDYWHTQAFIDIATGFGSKITALSSFGGNLIILKERGVFVLRGDVSTDGTDLGASVDTISMEIGCNSPSVAVTDSGVVFTSADGVFVTDGNSVTELSDGISMAMRETYIPTGVSAAASRIYVNCINRTLVYDMNMNAWYVWFLGEAGLRPGVYSPGLGNSSVNCLVQNSSTFDAWDLSTCWQGYAGTRRDDPVGVAPRLKVTTQPIPLSDSSVSTGRVNTIYANTYFTDDYSEDPTIDISMTYGVGGNDSGPTISDAILPDTIEKSTRVPVGESLLATAVSFTLEQTDKASALALYSLAIDYEPADRPVG